MTMTTEPKTICLPGRGGGGRHKTVKCCLQHLTRQLDCRGCIGQKSLTCQTLPRFLLLTVMKSGRQVSRNMPFISVYWSTALPPDKIA